MTTLVDAAARDEGTTLAGGSHAGSARISFRWESQMLPVLAEHLGSILASVTEAASDLDVVFEVPAASGGVPDVVAVAWDEDALVTRLDANLGPVEDATLVRVLLAIQSGAVSVSDVAGSAGVSVGHLRRSVFPRLVTAGWLDAAAGLPRIRGVQLLAPFKPVGRLVVTVEAKRTQWHRALHQGIRHAVGSDLSYVAMDSARADPARRYADTFSTLGVGLLTVDAETRTLSLVAHPTVGSIDRAARATLAERVWALCIAGKNSGPTFDVFGRRLPLHSQPSRSLD